MLCPMHGGGLGFIVNVNHTITREAAKLGVVDFTRVKASDLNSLHGRQLTYENGNATLTGFEPTFAIS
jgi:phosphotransferase system IIB component